MKKELITYHNPKSPISEIFRTLRTNIQFMAGDKKIRVLLVTSTFPEEGKSWTSSNLAVTFAQIGKKVILIDADMRKGIQHGIFDIQRSPGLSNYLSEIDSNGNEEKVVDITNYIQETEVDNLHIIPAGTVPPNPSELLMSSKMLELLEQLKQMCDIVIIDGTPCGLVTDSVILSRIVDSTLIITAHKQTKKDALSTIVRNIQNVGGKICGIVFNKVPMFTKQYKECYYYGSKTISKEEKDDKK